MPNHLPAAPHSRGAGVAAAEPPRTRTAGATIWLTGLPGAGKSTIAGGVAEQLRRRGRPVEILDGDEVRAWLSADLGFSREHRFENVRRIGHVARLLARNDVTVLVAAVSPYAESRDAVRAQHEISGVRYLEVHVATPVEVCAERDVKGLYARQRAGMLTGLTGVDDPYEPPEVPDLRIEAHRQRVADSVEAVLLLLADRAG